MNQKIRGNTDGHLSMGRKIPNVSSTKKKIIIRSFTETVIVAVGYCIPDVL